MFLDYVQKETVGHQLDTTESYSTQQWEREIVLRLLSNRPGSKVLVVWPSLGSELKILANQLGANGELFMVGTDSAVLAQLQANKANGTYTTRTTKNLQENAVYKRDSKIQAAVHIAPFDGVSLDFEDDSFDAVWCAFNNQPASEGISQNLIDEFYRVAQPDGFVAISQPPKVSA